MSLHGEKLENMGATLKQRSLITAFNEYGDMDEMIKEIKQMGIVRHNHIQGHEFCGNLNIKKKSVYVRKTRRRRKRMIWYSINTSQ